MADANTATPEEIEGREYIAKLAEADGEITFAREVRAGCWDHRTDVSLSISRARQKRHFAGYDTP